MWRHLALLLIVCVSVCVYILVGNEIMWLTRFVTLCSNTSIFQNLTLLLLFITTCISFSLFLMHIHPIPLLSPSPLSLGGGPVVVNGDLWCMAVCSKWDVLFSGGRKSLPFFFTALQSLALKRIKQAYTRDAKKDDWHFLLHSENNIRRGQDRLPEMDRMTGTYAADKESDAEDQLL